MALPFLFILSYKQYSFDKNQLNNGSIERRVMGNKEIIEEINKKIEICKEKINSKNNKINTIKFLDGSTAFEMYVNK